MPEFEDIKNKDKMYQTRKKQALKYFLNKKWLSFNDDMESLEDILLHFLNGEYDKQVGTWEENLLAFKEWFEKCYIFPGDTLFNTQTNQVALVDSGGEFVYGKKTPYSLYISGVMESIEYDEMYDPYCNWIKMVCGRTGEIFDV